MHHAGLVLEGGGMRGVYTSGVLDLFLDKGLEFSHIYGVSAGACNLCSYVSKQRGRAYDVNVDYLDSKHYCSVASLLTTGNLFNVDMCYHTIPEYLNPFDNETFMQYEGKAYAVVTNVETGQAEYLRLKNMDEDIIKVQASSSLPLVANMVKIDGKLYLDGGLADSIPIQKSVLDGNRKHVVVLTKEVGYRRKPIDKAQLALIKLRYAKYPKVTEVIEHRHIAYNACLDYLERLEKKGQIFVIRPQAPSEVARIEHDQEKMKALYTQGYTEAEDRYEALMDYLERGM
ncbi:MAG: patatin family protein [Lachnospiraceae bacterium]|nr:patatin family protein [Lachnospiraceae bacterium]